MLSTKLSRIWRAAPQATKTKALRHARVILDHLAAYPAISAFKDEDVKRLAAELLSMRYTETSWIESPEA